MTFMAFLVLNGVKENCLLTRLYSRRKTFHGHILLTSVILPYKSVLISSRND